MKAKLITCTLAFLAVISGLHIQLNIGWGRLADDLRSLFDARRRVLMVGYLPVT